MRFRRRDMIVEAKQFQYSKCLEGNWQIFQPVYGVRGAHTIFEKFFDWWDGYPSYYVDTPLGIRKLKTGDWIIAGMSEGLYVLPSKDFPKIFEPADPEITK